MRDREMISVVYSNRPAVVIGRHQNPWLEVRMIEDACDVTDFLLVFIDDDL